MLVWLDTPAQNQATRHLAGAMPECQHHPSSSTAPGSRFATWVLQFLWRAELELEVTREQRMDKRRAYFCICPLLPSSILQNLSCPRTFVSQHCKRWLEAATRADHSWSIVRFTSFVSLVSAAGLDISRCWRCCIVADFVDLSAIPSINLHALPSAPISRQQEINHQIA